jgi:hypothetical protein
LLDHQVFGDRVEMRRGLVEQQHSRHPRSRAQQRSQPEPLPLPGGDPGTVFTEHRRDVDLAVQSHSAQRSPDL